MGTNYADQPGSLGYRVAGRDKLQEVIQKVLEKNLHNSGDRVILLMLLPTCLKLLHDPYAHISTDLACRGTT